MPARSSCVSRNCGRLCTLPASWNRAGCPKRLPLPSREAYIQGISTRSVDDLVWAMLGNGVSKSQVSGLLLRNRRTGDAFLNRQIARRLDVSLARRHLCIRYGRPGVSCRSPSSTRSRRRSCAARPPRAAPSAIWPDHERLPPRQTGELTKFSAELAAFFAEQNRGGADTVIPATVLRGVVRKP